MSEGDQYIDKTLGELNELNEQQRHGKDIQSLMVVGFMFNYDLTEVLLIRKKRPEWQAGRLNGIGGRVQEGETEPVAMRREFKEEAGVDIPEWQRVCVVHGMGWTVHFFALGNTNAFHAARSETDEKLERIPCTGALPEDVINNLHWLIPMARLDYGSCPYDMNQHGTGDEG